MTSGPAGGQRERPGRDGLHERYGDLHLQGRLPLERFVTERIALADVESAFTSMQRGDVLRSVVVFN